MATFSKQFLSASTNGKGVKIAAIATPGTLLHTAHATAKDEVWVFVVNSSASSVKVTIEWGEATAPDGNIEVSVPAESGLLQVVPGLVVSGGVEVRAFAGTANVLIAHGFVNRIT